jgi:hypothetical protein
VTGRKLALALAVVTLPVLAAKAQDASSLAGARPAPAQMQARFQIAVMEGVLERAVQLGARKLSMQVQAVSPELLFVSGAAKARGFWLDGYGVFFDVDVPAMKRSVAWSMRMMESQMASLAQSDQSLEAALSAIKRYAQTVSDPAARRELDQAIQRLERTDRRPPQVVLPPGATGGPVMASDGSRMPGVPPTVAPGAPQSARMLDDPGLAYTNEVKNALVDAMIEYGAPIPIADTEWLTIAARDSDDSRLSGDLYDVSTIILRIRGADLSAYRARQISRDEALKRVDVREY